MHNIKRVIFSVDSKKNNPLILDIVDDWGCFNSQFYKRRKYYNDTGFFINSNNNKKQEYMFVE